MAGIWIHRPAAQRSLGWAANLSVRDIEVVFEMWLGLPSKRKMCMMGGDKRACDQG